MSRRHFGNQTTSYNIITGSDEAPAPSQPTQKYESLPSNFVFPSDNVESRFETTSGQIGFGAKNSASKDEQAPYYGRKKKTNEFYSENGVSFGEEAQQNQPQAPKPQNDESKYSRYY